MKKIVNRMFLGYILGGLGGLADVDEEIEKYNNLDVNDKQSVLKIIRDSCIPRILNHPSDLARERIKNTLQYYLSTDEIDFASVFNAHLLPFDHPTDAKDFFCWIWEALYQNESYELSESAKEEYFVLKHPFRDYDQVCQRCVSPENYEFVLD
jgi:hypothetical protein